MAAVCDALESLLINEWDIKELAGRFWAISGIPPEPNRALNPTVLKKPFQILSSEPFIPLVV